MKEIDGSEEDETVPGEPEAKAPAEVDETDEKVVNRYTEEDKNAESSDTAKTVEVDDSVTPIRRALYNHFSK